MHVSDTPETHRLLTQKEVDENDKNRRKRNKDKEELRNKITKISIEFQDGTIRWLEAADADNFVDLLITI